MKLLFLTGSRGEWGYIRPILRHCQQREIGYNICATNMHLLPGYGLSIEEIRSDGFEVSDEIYMSLDAHNRFTMAKSLGIFLTSFVDVLNRVKPDWLIIAGDRGEQMMGTIAGAYTYVPIAHIQAGELSGNIDGHARHAIGKFANLHFASNLDAADRLRRLGEEEFRIRLVGAPQLDELVEGRFTARVELEKKYDIDLGKPYFLVMQHPVTEEYEQAPVQIEAMLEALNGFPQTKIWIFPNNDAGSDAIKRGLMTGRKGDTYVFQNLKREDFLGFLKQAQCLIGNSSSGILEAPTFQIPAVNIGRRQANRLQGKNVINCEFRVPEIAASIRKASTQEFRASLQGMESPYGDGRSSERILDILLSTRRDSKLLCKQLTY